LSGGNILHDGIDFHADNPHSGCRCDCHLAKQFGRGSHGLLGRCRGASCCESRWRKRWYGDPRQRSHTRVFNTAGTYGFHCTIHPGM